MLMDSTFKQLTAGIKIDKSLDSLKSEFLGIDNSESNDGKKLYSLYKIKASQLIRAEEEKIIAIANELDDISGLKNCCEDIIYKYFVEYLKFNVLTPVQKICIGLGIKKQNLVCVAPTGSGKTYAYLLPIFNNLLRDASNSKSNKCLIIAPTRDLATQIFRLVESFSKYSQNLSVALITTKKLHKIDTANILLGTPGTLCKLLNSENTNIIKNLEYIIVDEFDLLLENNFIDQLNTIFTKCDYNSKQLIFVSATLPTRILNFINVLAPEILVIKLDLKSVIPKTIKQVLINTNTETQKLTALKQLICTNQFIPPCIIFVQDTVRAAHLKDELEKLNIRASALHGEIDPTIRQKIIDNFIIGNIWCLIASDIIGRGLNCVSIRTIINYDIPLTKENYIHRIGRTGRIGYCGTAYTFYINADIEYMHHISAIFKECKLKVPDDLKKTKKIKTKNLIHKNIQRKPIKYLNKKEYRLADNMYKKRKARKNKLNAADNVEIK